MTFYSFPDKALPHSKNRHVPYHPRLKWGLRWTLSFATIYSVWAAGVALLQGRTYFPQYHMSIWGIVAAYYVASLICGVALGFLYFLADRRWASVLLGFILGFLSYGVSGIAMFESHVLLLLIASILGGLIGAGVGLTMYDDEHKNDLPDGRGIPPDQKPLAVAGILGFMGFFMASGFGLPDRELYWVAGVCVGAPIGVWWLLRRGQRPSPQSSPHIS
jgi:hypothetical protein